MVVRVTDEDAVIIVIYRHSKRLVELAWLVASKADLGHERAIVARECLHSMVVAIDDKQEAAMVVERQASWGIEQAINMTIFLGANRELDSSINGFAIEELAHLAPIKLSRSCTRARDRDAREPEHC